MPSEETLIVAFIAWQFLFDCVIVWYAGRIVGAMTHNVTELDKRTRVLQRTKLPFPEE